jgi:hypothetical protein
VASESGQIKKVLPFDDEQPLKEDIPIKTADKKPQIPKDNQLLEQFDNADETTYV